MAHAFFLSFYLLFLPSFQGGIFEVSLSLSFLPTGKKASEALRACVPALYLPLDRHLQGVDYM
jgi:hypothetical protein